MDCVEVVDEIMGSGKSHATLRYIESLALSNKSEKWIYCTEYLTEIEQRTKENPLAEHLWRTPTVYDESSKTDNFVELLTEPDVQLIAITHSLLKSASSNDYINFLISNKGYKLFLDETLDFIEPYSGISQGNFLLALQQGFLSIDDSSYGKITWLADLETMAKGKSTVFDLVARDAKKGVVHCSINGGSASDSESVSVVYIHNGVVLRQFKRVILATYQVENTLFEAYLHIQKIPHKRCEDVVCYRSPTKQSLRDNIEFITQYDRVFKGVYALSCKWYAKRSKEEDYKALNKIIKSIGDKSGCKGKAHLLGFTVPLGELGAKRDKKKIQPAGYPHTACSIIVDGVEMSEKAVSCHIPCNARATNDYAHKTVMIHAFNRYVQPSLQHFFTRYEVPFSNERFALNEIVQWVWRCAVRNGEPIKLAIISERMRDLFTTWLKV